MRLIDADALWKKMYKYSDNEGAKMPYGDDSLIHRDSACFLIENAPTIEPEQHWIPCTPETMPECGQEVLTRDPYGCIWICSLIFTGRNNEAYWEDNYGYLYNLDEQIAWMPLPEQWKGE